MSDPNPSGRGDGGQSGQQAANSLSRIGQIFASPSQSFFGGGGGFDWGSLLAWLQPAAGATPGGAPASGAPAAPPPPSLGSQVVQYATARVGQRDGDGECFALVDNALRNAGARSASDFGQVTPTADYVWGTAVNLSDAQAGDLIQFRDYEFTVRREETDGSWEEETGDRPHHSAIVETVHDDGSIDVLEQNIPAGSGPVTRKRLYFRAGSSTSGTTTTTVTVSGTVHFYRPQARP